MSSTTEESDWTTLRKIQRPRSPEPIPEETELSIDSPSNQHSVVTTLPGADSTNSKSETLNSNQTLKEGLEDLSAAPYNAPVTPSLPEPPNGDDVQNEESSAVWQADSDSIAHKMENSQYSEELIVQSAVGRGGAKRGGRQNRGGRRPQIKIEPPPDETGHDASNARKINRGGRPRGSRAGTTSGRSTNRGTRARGSRNAISSVSTSRGAKRKRKKGTHTDDDEDEDDADNTDSSEEVTNLPTQSRSGRRITQASTFSPQLLAPSAHNSVNHFSLSPQVSAISPHLSASTANYTTSSVARKRKRITASAVCINCLRGHSPSSNQIVFCDSCNTPYHQLCHDRPITPTVILIEEREWNCSDCTKMVEESALLAGRNPFPESWEMAEKREYLHNLDKASLIAIVLHASELNPGLPIFKPLPAPPTKTTIVPSSISPSAALSSDATVLLSRSTQPSTPLVNTVTASAASFSPNTQINSTTADAKNPSTLIFQPKSLEFTYPESETLPYPKAGNGIRLPPEEDDTMVLVDEDNVIYSHSWIVVPSPIRPGAVAVGGLGADKIGERWVGAISKAIGVGA